MLNKLDNNDNIDSKVLKNFLLQFIVEKRRARRWSLFFKFATLILICYFSMCFISRINLASSSASNKSIYKEHAALINVVGTIDFGEDASSDNISKALKNAFSSDLVKGIILRINSPGGSAVQARQIYDEIKRLKKQRESLVVYAAIEDLGASAAYLVASAADEIYADETSLVGSIGVLLGNGFGFYNAMEKLGIERRLISVGKHKALLDPFSPRNVEEEAFIKRQLAIVHNKFINNVKQGRGERLQKNEEIFSGLIWSGQEAKKLGLIDGFLDYSGIAREKIKNIEIVNYSQEPDFLEKFVSRLSLGIVGGIKNLFSFF